MKLKTLVMATGLVTAIGLSACDSPVIVVKCNNMGGIDNFSCHTTGAIESQDESACAQALDKAKNMCAQDEQLKVTISNKSPSPTASPSNSYPLTTTQ
jgi:hypothetical protein